MFKQQSFFCSKSSLSFVRKTVFSFVPTTVPNLFEQQSSICLNNSLYYGRTTVFLYFVRLKVMFLFEQQSCRQGTVEPLLKLGGNSIL
jgi:hypothetical protein